MRPRPEEGDLLIGGLLLVGGIALILWGAERFTDGAVRTAARFTLSTFFVGAVASGFEPENLVTGAAAALGQLPQIALGTVIGSAVFMLTAGLGVTLLLVPLEVGIPRLGALAMIVTLVPFALALWNDGVVSRPEGLVLLAVAVGLMTLLYRRSPAFPSAPAEDDDHPPAGRSAGKALGLLVLGVGVMVIGAELVVRGVRTLLESAMLSETFLGMTVVGMAESLEETARMVTPARRGHPELALGNVVGTVVVLLLFNLGVIALLRPLVADPLVLRFHVPYLIACVLLVACVLLSARVLGRGLGLVLVGLCVVYVAINLTHMWRYRRGGMGECKRALHFTMKERVSRGSTHSAGSIFGLGLTAVPSTSPPRRASLSISVRSWIGQSVRGLQLQPPAFDHGCRTHTRCTARFDVHWVIIDRCPAGPHLKPCLGTLKGTVAAIRFR